MKREEYKIEDLCYKDLMNNYAKNVERKMNTFDDQAVLRSNIDFFITWCRTYLMDIMVFSRRVWFYGFLS